MNSRFFSALWSFRFGRGETATELGDLEAAESPKQAEFVFVFLKQNDDWAHEEERDKNHSNHVVERFIEGIRSNQQPNQKEQCLAKSQRIPKFIVGRLFVGLEFHVQVNETKADNKAEDSYKCRTKADKPDGSSEKKSPKAFDEFPIVKFSFVGKRQEAQVANIRRPDIHLVVERSLVVVNVSLLKKERSVNNRNPEYPTKT